MGLSDEFLSTCSSAQSEICSFWRLLKAEKDCAILARKESKRDLMAAGFKPYLIDVKKCAGVCRPVFYKRYVLESIWREVLIAGSEEVFFLLFELGHSNRDKVRFHAVHYEFFDDCLRDTVLHMICPGK